MQKEVPIECRSGKKIYFSLRQPPLWKGWIMKPSHPELLIEPIYIQAENLLLSKSSLTYEEINSLNKYLYFRVDEVLNWNSKDRILKEFEFMYDALSKIDIFSKKETSEFYEIIKEGYGRNYYSDKCGRLLYSYLRFYDKIIYDESQIDPISFRSPSLADLREHFVQYVISQSNSIEKTKSLSVKKASADTMVAILNRIPAWKDVEFDNIKNKLAEISI